MFASVRLLSGIVIYLRKDLSFDRLHSQVEKFLLFSCLIPQPTPEQHRWVGGVCCLGGVGCFTKHRQEMNPGIKLESATSGLNYSSWLFFRWVINDLAAPLTPLLKCKYVCDLVQCRKTRIEDKMKCRVI